MTKTIFITGASSGIGRAAALRFQAAGWNVVATMRNIDDGTAFAEFDNVYVAHLDVQNEASIALAVTKAISRFGAIHVLLNNAGYGAYGPLEAFDLDGVRRQFETNVIGLLAVTKAVLPHMRECRDGVIINMSSIGGKVTFPLGSLYHGTKFAVEGLSEALHYELEPLGIRVKIVEPGFVNTDFGGRSFDFRNDPSLTEYQGVVASVAAGFAAVSRNASGPSAVADVIFNAATDGGDTLRYIAGSDAVELLATRKTLDDAAFITSLKSSFHNTRS